MEEEELGAILSSFVFTMLAIKGLNPLADRIGLIDVPNYRKKHEGAVPVIGGLSIFLGVAVSALLFMDLNYQLTKLLLASLVIVEMGVFDDLYDLSVRLRLCIQAICTFILCLSLDVSVADLGYIFGFTHLNIGIGGYVLTIFVVIAGINAFNMMDGIDGLAGSMALVSLISLIFLFAVAGASGYMMWALLFAVAIVPFLFANLKLAWFRRKIFMGDAGSTLLGFVIVWLLILGSQQADRYFRIVTALWIIAIPLMDMAAVLIRRVRKGTSPFKPDRKHLHYICLRAGLNSRQALGVIVAAQLLLISFGVVCEIWQIPEWIMLIGFLCLFVGYYDLLHRICKIVRWVGRVKGKKLYAVNQSAIKKSYRT